MSRYIDADAFERAVMFSDDEDIQDVIYRLRDFPTTDVVEVVRCKDCKHYNGDSAVCKCMNRAMKGDGFCSYGERRTYEQIR